MDKKEKRGFTLAELLIVVAIIAVLVAIAIPVFTSRLEQSRETTDLANLRSAYAAGQVAAMNGIGGTKVQDLSKATDGTWYFNPNEEYGLNSSADKGTVIGQGTSTDGKVDTTTLPDIINYNTKQDVRGHKIVAKFNSSGLSAVQFDNYNSSAES